MAIQPLSSGRRRGEAELVISSQCGRHLLGIQSESSKVVEEINTIVPRNCCPEELLQLYSVGPRAAETNSSGRVFF